MTEETQVVSEGKVVVFHYTLTNETGEQIETSKDKQPLPYLHGANNIVPGLEKEMEGKEPGDSFEATIPPAEGYGQREEPGPQKVDRGEFPEDVELYEGMQFTGEAEGGQLIPLWITDIEGDQISVDHNHPLAGETLNFEVEIVDVRNATDEEIEHGHAHGVDGTHSH